MSTPDQIAQGFARAAHEVKDGRELIRKVLLTVEGRAKGRSPVRTGTLRRSITTEVLSARQGVVGSNLGYAVHVHEGTKYMPGRPFLKEGLEDSQADIENLMEKYGDDALSKVGR